MQFSVLILVVSVLVRLCFAPRRVQTVPRHRRSAHGLTVLLLSEAHRPWRNAVARLVGTAGVSLSINVLLECTKGAPRHDTAYSGIVHVELGLKRSEHPNARVRRLARRFLTGDEGTAVILPYDSVAPRPNWGVHAVALAEARPDAVLSCPVSTGAQAAPRFPTLRRRSNGSIARDDSVAFAQRAEGAAVALPSVCWCPEMTVGSGAVLKRWCAIATDAFVRQTLQGPPHLVPVVALLDPNADLEETLLDHDAGDPEATLTPWSKVGLSPAPDERERILKYGSVFRSKAAVEAAQRDA